MQAVILAGGEGTRLRPLTYATPKPVIPLANRPFISYMIEWLAANGVDDVVMACGFLSDGVRSVLGDSYHGIPVRYVTEPDARGTGGAVKFCQELLDERFFVLNGDVLTDFDLVSVRQFHEQVGARATLSLIGVADPTAYGLVRVEDDGRIAAFLEKPDPEEIDTDLINAGAYVMERSVIDEMESDRAVSFERETFPSLIGEGLYGRRVEGYWLDIGTPDRYIQATRDIIDGTVKTTAESTADERLLAPSLVADGCEIADGATVGPLSSLGKGCRIGSGARIERAVLHDAVQVGPDALVRDTIIGAGAKVGAGAQLVNQTVVGSGEVVESGLELDAVRLPEG